MNSVKDMNTQLSLNTQPYFNQMVKKIENGHVLNLPGWKSCNIWLSVPLVCAAFSSSELLSISTQPFRQPLCIGGAPADHRTESLPRHLHDKGGRQWPWMLPRLLLWRHPEDSRLSASIFRVLPKVESPIKSVQGTKTINVVPTSTTSELAVQSYKCLRPKRLQLMANSWPETNDGGRFSSLGSTTEEEKENETSVRRNAVGVICVGGESCPHFIRERFLKWLRRCCCSCCLLQ